MDFFKDEISLHGTGVIIKLFVKFNTIESKFPSGFNKWRKRIEITVDGIAKNNQANYEVIKTIANFFDKQINNVYILKGKKSKEKTIFIENISKTYVIKTLKEHLDGL